MSASSGSSSTRWRAGSGRCASPATHRDRRSFNRGPHRSAGAAAVPAGRALGRCPAAGPRARAGARLGPRPLDRRRRRARRARRAVDPGDARQMDAASRHRLPPQHRHQLHRHGDRHRARHAARADADLAFAPGARLLLGDDAVLPQRALARALVLLHAAPALRDADRAGDRAAAGLAQGDLRPVACGDGERLRARARRRAVDPVRAVGILGGARLLAPPDIVDDHPTAMREAHAAAVDEPLRDPRRRHGARLDRRRQRGDDADRRRACRREPHRAPRADVSLPAALVLRLLLPDRPRDRRARAPLPGALMTPMPWTPDQPLVRIADVQKAFGAVTVLSGVSLNVMKGEVICVIGPSGSGKSTLLRCINALVSIERGSILVEGQEVNDPKLDKLALRRRVGMVFQQYNLFPHKTALQNVMMAPIHVLREDKAEVEARARRLIRKVRLEGKESAYPGELSGGQQQRVAIARSLAMNPDVMLFDEVTAALDPETVKEVLVTIRELAEEGMTCVIVTHEVGFAREVADHIYFTDRGVIVEHGPPKDFFANARDPRTQQFLSQIL